MYASRQWSVQSSIAIWDFIIEAYLLAPSEKK